VAARLLSGGRLDYLRQIDRRARFLALPNKLVRSSEQFSLAEKCDSHHRNTARRHVFLATLVALAIDLMTWVNLSVAVVGRKGIGLADFKA
jgi:ABC-type uncharacterized transport system auxiliary subunit